MNDRNIENGDRFYRNGQGGICMRSKRVKWMQHVIVFVLVIAMLLPMTTPVSVQAAESDLYLAYQEDESGYSVLSMQKSIRGDYRVDELFLHVGDKADLCYINAPKGGTVQWTSSNSNVVEVDSKGVVTAISNGIAEVTLKYTKKSIFSTNKMSVTAKIYVGEENWNVEIAAGKFFLGKTINHELYDSYNLVIGGDLGLYVYGISDIDNNRVYAVKWSSSDNAVVDMSAKGIYAKKAGTAVITAKITNKIVGTTTERKVTVHVAEPTYKESKTWNNPYYLMYGENYLRIFGSSYMRLATNATELDLTDYTIDYLAKKMDLIGLSGVVELADIKNSLSMSIESVIQRENSKLKKIHEEAILYLVQSLISEDSLYVQNVKEALTKTKEIVSSMDNVNSLKDEIKKIEEAALNIKAEEMNSILNYVLHDGIGDIEKMLSEGVTITDYAALALCLYEMDCQILDDLQKCSCPGDVLYDDVQMLKEQKEKYPVEYFKERYCTDVFTRGAVKVILKLAGKESMALLTAVGEVVQIFVDMTGAPSLSDLVKAQFLMLYLSEVKYKINDFRDEMLRNFKSYSNEELMKRIEEYELAYQMYLSMLDPVTSAVLELEKYGWDDGVAEETGMAFNMGYDYNRHIAMAMSAYLYDNPEMREKGNIKDTPQNNNGSKTQYGYYHYTDGNGDYAVCAYYGQETDGWKNIYREEIWVDEPLKLVSKSATSYKHPEVSGCKTAGCLEGDFWLEGGKFVDEDGVSWYREQTRVVSGDVNETQELIVIKGNSVVSGNGDITDSVLQDRMEELVSELLRANRGIKGNANATEAYFTTTGKEYKADSGKICKNTNVIEETWFTDVFGTVKVDNFPKHLQSKGNGDSNIGYSCFGFACFAQWYIYKNNNDDKVTAKQIASGEYTKEFLKNNLQVGDIIRIYISKNGNKYYHSMVFHSFTENGMIVLDCNRNTDNKVRLNEIKYNREGWSGDPVWIYRVQE